MRGTTAAGALESRNESALRSRARLTRRSVVYVAGPRRGNRNVVGLLTHRIPYLRVEARGLAAVDVAPRARFGEVFCTEECHRQATCKVCCDCRREVR